MLTILNSLNAHYLPIFQPILMIPVQKFMVHRALSNKIYFSLGLLSPLSNQLSIPCQYDYITSKDAKNSLDFHMSS